MLGTQAKLDDQMLVHTCRWYALLGTLAVRAPLFAATTGVEVYCDRPMDNVMDDSPDDSSPLI